MTATFQRVFNIYLVKHIAYKGFVKLLVIVPLDAAGNRKKQNKNKNTETSSHRQDRQDPKTPKRPVRSVHDLLLVVLIAERPVWSVKS